jgi:hypothetical protein
MTSTNTVAINEIQAKISETAPEGAKVSWNFPGYISIVLVNETEICFGESLESDSGYSWNDMDAEGTNRFCGSFDDLGNLDAIVAEFWNQTAEVLV